LINTPEIAFNRVGPTGRPVRHQTPVGEESDGALDMCSYRVEGLAESCGHPHEGDLAAAHDHRPYLRAERLPGVRPSRPSFQRRRRHVASAPVRLHESVERGAPAALSANPGFLASLNIFAGRITDAAVAADQGRRIADMTGAA
jgi:hypothetical protein